MQHFWWHKVLGAIVLLAAAVSCPAAPVAGNVGPGEELWLYLNPGTDDDTGVRVWNLSTFIFKVEIEGVTTPLPPADPVEPGFQLVDTTLLNFTTTDESGQGTQSQWGMIGRVRIKYDRARVAARLRRMGRRMAELRLMRRREKADGTWQWRSVPRLMRARRKKALRIAGAPPSDVLRRARTAGVYAYGVDEDREYVWATVDRPGTYGIGIPEPLSVSLLAAGSGLGWWQYRRRR